MGLVPHTEESRYRPRTTSLRRLLLHSAIASRVLVRVGSFRARGFPELERRLRGCDLSRFAPERGAEVEVTSRKSRLYHTGAIEERVRRTLSLQPPSDDTPPLRLVVRVVRDEFTLSADASGEVMHRRGYRLRTAKAPMRETLAAAMLRISGWTPDRPLHDPFCGSGTLGIEAARRALGIAPGIDRDFDAERWEDADASAWNELRDEARTAVRPDRALRISGIRPGRRRRRSGLRECGTRRGGRSRHLDARRGVGRADSRRGGRRHQPALGSSGGRG